jgi:hypothetical protein
MDLKDATLMILTESAAHPEVAALAQSAHDTLADGGEVPLPILSDLLAEVSGKGVLRALREKYSIAAFEAMIMPMPRDRPAAPGPASPAPRS